MSRRSESISASTEQWLNSAADGVMIVDPLGHIRLMNRQAEVMFGYALAEVEGEPLETLIPERAEGGRPRHRAEYLRNEPKRSTGTQLDIAGRRKDGSVIPVDVSLSLLESDRGLLMSVAVRDSAKRTSVDMKPQDFDATERLAAIVQSSQDAIVGKTLDGVITSWNAGAERLYGYTAAEIIGHNVSELAPADRADELASIVEQVRAGQPVQHFETQRVAKDGRILDMSIAVSPIRDATGAVSGASTVARDMTEIKHAEAYRRALEAQLHQAQRLESLGQLAGGVAHDFNNLLAGIMNYAGLIALTLADETTRPDLTGDEVIGSMLDDVNQITMVAKRAAALTRQLLIFSRGEVLQPQTLDLNSIVDEMEQLLRRTIGHNVEHLQTVLTPDLPLITVDRGHIEQVIMNLAVNARDAMPAGGELAIETAVFQVDEQYARLHAIKPGAYVRLSVSDTGMGMSPEVAARAFEPFFTTKPKGQGTGLGLATVFGIVTQAGGNVVIYSEPDLGTTVRVHFPTTQAEPESRAAETHPSLRARGETVLVVEDEEIVREPTRRMLARYGYEVLTASNAREAMEIVHRRTGPIHLLLTDLVMPGRSGKALSVEVVAHRPTTKLLFMSGYSEHVVVHEGVLDADASLIEKPFSADDLLRRIRDVLDGGS